MSDLLLALDFGGTKHSLACLRLETARELVAAGDAGRALAWQAHRRVFSPPGADAQYDLKTVFNLAHELLDGERPGAIGVSFGGPVDYSQGLVRLSHHVPGWENTPLQQMLEDKFNAPAAVDNDANVAALGEAWFGAGWNADSLLYITVSTGVGGGWILNRKPWRGAQGMAGEIGHTVIDPQGPRCLCGKSGCVERLASGPYMACDARQKLQEYPQSGAIIRRLAGGDLTAVTAKLLAEAAAAGDALAWEFLKRSARALGVAIGNAANLLNPERFILGGGVTKSGERYWEAINQAARQTALPQVDYEILPAALGDDAPLWGALALAMTRLEADTET
ncbi:MAG: ROK family protein [Anaerolineales bacterium]|jgi:glucokinase